MKILKILSFILIHLGVTACHAQSTKEVTGRTLNPKFEQRINRLIDFSVPTLNVDSFATRADEYLILDAREREEYEVSHIPNAQYLGYKNFDPMLLEQVAKDQKIVLYCSVGYRSEKIGDQLMKLGFTNVHNLYGSIFEWINQGHPVVDKNGEPTNKVHTYNSKWSKWVMEGKAEKTW
jgi:rhodanese-related sulfurtransferase